MPDIRVWAENSTGSASFSEAVAAGGSPWSWAQSSTMLRPSGVSSTRLEAHAAAASSAADILPTGARVVA